MGPTRGGSCQLRLSQQQMQTQIDKDAPAYTIQGEELASARYSSISPAPNGVRTWLISPTMSVGCQDSSAPATMVRGELKRECLATPRGKNREKTGTVGTQLVEREPACTTVCRSLFRRPHHLAPAG